MHGRYAYEHGSSFQCCCSLPIQLYLVDTFSYAASALAAAAVCLHFRDWDPCWLMMTLNSWSVVQILTWICLPVIRCSDVSGTGPRWRKLCTSLIHWGSIGDFYCLLIVVGWICDCDWLPIPGLVVLQGWENACKERAYIGFCET